MQPDTTERVQKLRVEAAKANSRLSDLKQRLASNSDEWVNGQLKLAESLLSDVESFFIAMVENGQAQNEAFVLTHAQFFLINVVQPQLHNLLEIVNKYGPGVRTIR